LPHDVGPATMSVNGCLTGNILSNLIGRQFYLYHLFLLLPNPHLPFPKAGRGGKGQDALPRGARVRPRPFIRPSKSVVITVNIALTTTILIIQSGSWSYIMQSPTIGNTVLFSMTTFDVCVCVCACVRAIYTKFIYDAYIQIYNIQRNIIQSSSQRIMFEYLHLFAKLVVSIGQSVHAIIENISFVIKCTKKEFCHFHGL